MILETKYIKRMGSRDDANLNCAPIEQDTRSGGWGAELGVRSWRLSVKCTVGSQSWIQRGQGEAKVSLIAWEALSLHWWT